MKFIGRTCSGGFSICCRGSSFISLTQFCARRVRSVIVLSFAALWFRIFESSPEANWRARRHCVASAGSLKVRRGVVSPHVRAPNMTLSSGTDRAAPPRRSIPRPWRVCNPHRFTTACHVTHLSRREFWDPRPLTPYLGHCAFFAPDRSCILQDHFC